jgi:hypothetical protein
MKQKYCLSNNTSINLNPKQTNWQLYANLLLLMENGTMRLFIFKKSMFEGFLFIHDWIGNICIIIISWSKPEKITFKFQNIYSNFFCLQSSYHHSLYGSNVWIIIVIIFLDKVVTNTSSDHFHHLSNKRVFQSWVRN